MDVCVKKGVRNMRTMLELAVFPFLKFAGTQVAVFITSKLLERLLRRANDKALPEKITYYNIEAYKLAGWFLIEQICVFGCMYVVIALLIIPKIFDYRNWGLRVITITVIGLGVGIYALCIAKRIKHIICKKVPACDIRIKNFKKRLIIMTPICNLLFLVYLYSDIIDNIILKNIVEMTCIILPVVLLSALFLVKEKIIWCDKVEIQLANRAVPILIDRQNFKDLRDGGICIFGSKEGRRNSKKIICKDYVVSIEYKYADEYLKWQKATSSR